MKRRSIYGAIHEKCVEPCKRNKDGERWIVHRFPIKGGISLRDAMLADMARPNPLFRQMTEAADLHGNFVVGETLRIRLPQGRMS